jgi:hypothetical protein
MRIRIDVKSLIRIRIDVKYRIWIRIDIKCLIWIRVKCRIQIRIDLKYWIRDSTEDNADRQRRFPPKWFPAVLWIGIDLNSVADPGF